MLLPRSGRGSKQKQLASPSTISKNSSNWSPKTIHGFATIKATRASTSSLAQKRKPGRPSKLSKKPLLVSSSSIPPVKRSRGRPKKVSVDEMLRLHKQIQIVNQKSVLAQQQSRSTNGRFVRSVVSSSNPSKRGRERSRKHQVPSGAPPKRGIGRPRKMQTIGGAIETPVERKRGRPRKVDQPLNQAVVQPAGLSALSVIRMRRKMVEKREEDVKEEEKKRRESEKRVKRNSAFIEARRTRSMVQQPMPLNPSAADIKPCSASRGQSNPNDALAAKKRLGLHYPGKVYRLIVKDGKEKEKSLAKTHASQVSQIIAVLSREDMNRLTKLMDEIRKDYGRSEKRYVIGASCDGRKILVKYLNIPTAVWISRGLDDDFLKQHRFRMELEDKIAIYLQGICKEKKLDFTKEFGGRYLKSPNGNDIFSTDEMAQLHTLIRARESDINEINAVDGLPPIYVMDWSGEHFDYRKNSLFEFEYTNFMWPSARVRKVMNKGQNTMGKHWCDKNCRCALDGCACRRDKSWESLSQSECWDTCPCSIETCPNRVVQRGRQVPLVMMRDRVKGWTMRAATPIKKGQYICEYTGEVLTYAEHLARNDETYSIEYFWCFEDKDKKPEPTDNEGDRARSRGWWMTGYCHRKFVITAKKKGNEGRTFSHSCRPNMKIMATYLERHGYGYHRWAFYAMEDIEIGAELTWNYFGDQLTIAQRENKKIWSPTLHQCSCGFEECAIKSPPRNLKHDEEDPNDSCSSADEEEEEEVPSRASSSVENRRPRK